MSYHIYTTRGIVLSARPVGEADRIYAILTRELGLVRARAISVRKGTSKLRGSVEPYTLAHLSFVRGKEQWRLTSAEVIKRLPTGESVLKPLALLEKLVQGEAHHPELFDAIEEKLENTMIYHSVEEKELFEINFVSTVLFHLGYLKEKDLKLPKKELLKAINEGLKHSHLI
jgi:DNA repair protein RecO